MCSLKESKVEKFINDNQYKDLLTFAKYQLIRSYPEGSRIYSSNYDPIRMWNSGIQMVALNYQTKDKAMQLNHAKFKQNGNCGYVLMPSYMQAKHYNPFTKPSNLKAFSPIQLKIKVICARNLRKKIKGILCPAVEVEVIGANFDNKKYLTKIIGKLCVRIIGFGSLKYNHHESLIQTRMVCAHRGSMNCSYST